MAGLYAKLATFKPVFTELRVSVPLGKRMLLERVGSESVGICAGRLRAQTSNLKNPEVILRREEMGKSGTAISWFDQVRKKDVCDCQSANDLSVDLEFR